MDFLSANNSCGQALLSLVSRGNAIIAELLRLRNVIPEIFVKKQISPLDKIIRNFSYFENSEYYDSEIANSSVSGEFRQVIVHSQSLEKIDQQIKENFSDILTRFYFAFESIHTYVTDLNKYLDELEEGIYIQQSIETVLQCTDGKQLMIESCYLYGVMLLALDFNIDGGVREKLIVSYYRYNGTKYSSNIDDVCALLRSTNYNGTKRSNAIYPCDYFSRIPFKSPGFIQKLLARLRSDDIYLQMSSYPLPNHSTVCLSSQASTLYILLFFDANTLKNETAKMRQFIDKHFHDNWVISIYMGITVNLLDAWYQFPAAYSALSNTVNSMNIKKHALFHGEQVPKLTHDLYKYLSSGALTEQVVCDKMVDLLALIRASNVTMKWLVLHSAAISAYTDSSKKCRQINELVKNTHRISEQDILMLIILSSQFEFIFKEMFTKLLEEKSKNWTELIEDCVSKSKELSSIFNGDYILKNLKKWFFDISEQILSLKFEDELSTGRKIVQLIYALEQVQEFHQLDTQIQVCEHLECIRVSMRTLLRIININESVLITLATVTDLSYAWILIDSYTDIIQKRINVEPKVVIRLRAVFLKLATAMEIPLMRINQSQSNDLLSVSQYYSSVLVTYFRRVLQVIPESMFNLLSQLITIQTEHLKELPMRLNKDQLKEYAQLDHRYKIVKLTNNISIFTEGILEMKSTLVGVIKIDPKQILEEGIRKELVKHVALTLHESLIFSHKPNDLIVKLNKVGEKIDGFKRSFEYIQDYINICGLRIWHEELSRIINFNIEHECNSFLHNKIDLFQSIHQSETIPIPVYSKADKFSCNFIGRLAREIMRLTDPKYNLFVSLNNAWYDMKSKSHVISTDIFDKIENSIGTLCLSGLYDLYGFMIVHKLQFYFASIDRYLKEPAIFREFMKTLDKSQTIHAKVYSQLFSRFQLTQFVDIIIKIGQIQILRKAIGEKLRILGRNNCTGLFSSLSNVNNHMLADIQRSTTTKDTTCIDSENIAYITQYLNAVGIEDVYSKIYVTKKRTRFLSIFNFIITASTFSKLQYLQSTGEFMASAIDGASLMVGMVTIQKQCHSNDTRLYMDYLSKYACSFGLSGEKHFNLEMKNCLIYMKSFREFSSYKKSRINIPEFILDSLKV